MQTTTARSPGTPARGETARQWFLVNFGILYAITFVAGVVAAVAEAGKPDGWALLYGVPLGGLLVIELTLVFTAPAFTLYLVSLRLARRRWPRRMTAWILTPLLTWAVFWTWPDDGEGTSSNFAIALASVAAAAALVRV